MAAVLAPSTRRAAASGALIILWALAGLRIAAELRSPFVHGIDASCATGPDASHPSTAFTFGGPSLCSLAQWTHWTSLTADSALMWCHEVNWSSPELVLARVDARSAASCTGRDSPCSPLVRRQVRLHGSSWFYVDHAPLVLEDGVAVVVTGQHASRVVIFDSDLEERGSWTVPGTRAGQNVLLASAGGGKLFAVWGDGALLHVERLAHTGRHLSRDASYAVRPPGPFGMTGPLRTAGGKLCVERQSYVNDEDGEEPDWLRVSSRWLVLGPDLVPEVPSIVHPLRNLLDQGLTQALLAALLVSVVALVRAHRAGALLRALRRKAPGRGLWVGIASFSSREVGLLSTTEETLTLDLTRAQVLGLEGTTVSGPCVVVGERTARDAGAYRSAPAEIASGDPFVVSCGDLDDAIRLAAIPSARAWTAAYLVWCATGTAPIAFLLFQRWP